MRHMLTTDHKSTDFVSYPAPNGVDDLDLIADQLHADFPRPHKGQFGRWHIKFLDIHAECRWIEA